MSLPRHDPYAALRVLNFRWFVASLMAMTIATQIQAVVVAWQIYDLTHDPLSLGLIGLAEAVPFIGVALFAGHVADRMSRLRISLIALAALFVCSVALLGFTLAPGIITPGRVWPIYLVIFLSGIARSFLQPARSALGAELVPRELYPNAVTWRSSTWQFATVVGPAVGGLVYGFGSASAAYALDAVIMGISVLALAAMRHSPLQTAASGESFVESLTTGIRFVRRKPIVLGALSLDLFSVLFGGAVALLPVFAAEILHVGPQGLGILRAAPAVGAVTMSVLLAHLPPLRQAGRTLLYSVALFGLCMIGFGLSRNFLLSIALLGASGMADTVSVVVRSTLLQVLTPTYLLGRVSAVNAIFIGSSNEIGAFESGTAARLIGTVPAVVLGGMATLVVVAITAVKVPSLRRLGRIEELGAGS
ncbi:MAG TPA: MFS transporter [Gemmatimonadales bacterium]|nr:MFS transporter [Gemmatimonadales bacterium]